MAAINIFYDTMRQPDKFVGRRVLVNPGRARPERTMYFYGLATPARVEITWRNVNGEEGERERERERGREGEREQ